jgi:quercetin dioxygenase-like cupin family protein
VVVEWPDFVEMLPEADLQIDGLRGWLLSNPDGQLLLLKVLTETSVPEHSHGAQWGIVIEGEIELTVSGHQMTCRAGDSYSIEAGELHSAVLKKGTRVIDLFEDSDRYRTKLV